MFKVFADVLATEVNWRRQGRRLAAAEAELEAIRARIAADETRYCALPQPGEAEALSGTASRAERLVTLRQAEAQLTDAEGALALLQAEESLVSARRNIQGPSDKKEEKAETSLQKARPQIAAAQQAVETAQAALQTNSSSYTPLSPVYPSQSTGRRRALATWMTSRQNPLTARVAVNHIWLRHFHAPLVASVFDFGRNGARPTHPELLDWLAVEFMEHGWSTKYLHRLMVTSRTYRQTSIEGAPPGLRSKSETEAGLFQPASPTLERDPESRFLSRMNLGQMDAEVVRDSILYLAGELDLAPVGYPLPNLEAEKSCHRSLYFECFPEPGGQSPFAELFGAPNPTECYRRSQTIIPQQALALANSKLSNERSRSLARQLVETLPALAERDEKNFITAACEQVLARLPTQKELNACQEFLAKQSKIASADFARVSLVHVLFNHNDFVTIR